MGKCRVDIHKEERQYHNISFSDIDVIKGLLLFRHKLDLFNRYGEDPNQMDAAYWKNVNQEAIVLYADLDVLISKCNFSPSQMAVLNLIGYGFEFDDISDYVGIEVKRIRSIFNSCCKRILQHNNRDWMTTIYLNRYATNWKTCRVCKKSLPLNDKFFRQREEMADGFYNECKICKP